MPVGHQSGCRESASRVTDSRHLRVPRSAARVAAIGTWQAPKSTQKRCLVGANSQHPRALQSATKDRQSWHPLGLGAAKRMAPLGVPITTKPQHLDWRSGWWKLAPVRRQNSTKKTHPLEHRFLPSPGASIGSRGGSRWHSLGARKETEKAPLGVPIPSNPPAP